MEKVVGSKVYKSNGKFYEFYQFSDLPRYLQDELTDSVFDDERDTIECNQYLHIRNHWYSLSDFLTTYHNPWLGNFADEYHNNNIHGLLCDDYDIAIELNNSDDGYRSWVS